MTSRLRLSKHLAHNLGNLLLLGKIGVFHNRRNASSRLLLLISKHLILCIYLVLMNAMRQAHADGWFIVFDTLTLADDRLEAFYDNPNALRDYFRDIGRMVLAAEGRKANDSHADCYQYFCVPEYGTANGRLHFHAVHF